MPRLAITLNTSWNIYNHRLGLLRALEKEGFEIFAVAPKDSYSEKIPYQYVNWNLNQRGKNPITEISSYFDLKSIYKKIKPNIALHYTIKPNIYGTFAAKAINIPCICNVSGLGYSFQKDSGVLQNIVSKIYLKALSRSDKVFFQNKDDCKYFFQLKSELIPISDILPGSGVNISKFHPISKNANATITFLMASRLFKEKGVEEYIKAAEIIRSRYPKTRFLLIGDIYQTSNETITYDYLHQNSNKGIIEYLGMQEDVFKFMQMADCVVLPTYYREGCPKVLIEAASCGLPIITTKNIGCTDIVQDNFNGFLCDKQSVDSLVNSIEKFILLDSAEKNRLGNNGRKKVVDEFDEQIIIKKYIESIKSLL